MKMKWRKLRKAPAPARNMALFLDFDGTLVDLAPRPDAVDVTGMLVDALSEAQKILSGAVCIVTGRAYDDVSRRLAPVSLPIAAEFGGHIVENSKNIVDSKPLWPQAWAAELDRAQQEYPGMFQERKTAGVALHFLSNPELEPVAAAVAERLARLGGGRYEAKRAKTSYELRQTGIDKGKAVDHFMRGAAFAGRVPVFIGDDHPDEPGFAAAERHGGHGLHVDVAFDGSAGKVRDWLAGFRALA